MTALADATPTSRGIPLEPGGELNVVLSAGSVRVHGTDGDRVVVRIPSGRPIDDVLAIDAAPASIRIHDLGRGFRLGPLELRAPSSEDVELEVPRWAGVAVRTMSGDIEAQGIGGRSQWATASGDIRVDLAGGPVSVETLSGDVELEADATIELTARSVSGDLHLRAPRFVSLSASTTSGDVHLDAALGAAGAYRVSSVSGDVELVTPSPVTVSTETITGDVRVSGRHTASGGPGRRSVVIGDGSVHVAIRTTSGDIRLAARAAPATGDAAVAADPERPRPDAPVPSLVAEAEAAPNLVRAHDLAASADDPGEPPDIAAGPAPDTAAEPAPETAAAPGAPTPAGDRDAARLDVLRALERGELDVATAAGRLQALDEGGTRDA
jgi:Toastrack DUF4097